MRLSHRAQRLIPVTWYLVLLILKPIQGADKNTAPVKLFYEVKALVEAFRNRWNQKATDFSKFTWQVKEMHPGRYQAFEHGHKGSHHDRGREARAL